MKHFRETLVVIFAISLACILMAACGKTEQAQDTSAVQTDQAAQTEQAESGEPVLGSWVLNEVYDVSGDEPVLLGKEDHQSFYGSGIGIYTFFEDGLANYNAIDAGDNVDTSASWESAEPGVYSFTEEGSDAVTLKYAEGEDALHRTYEDAEQKLDFVYARAVVGSWKLDQVLEIHEGDAPDELSREENASLYGEGETIYTFAADGTGETLMKDGADEAVLSGKWTMAEPDSYIYEDQDGSKDKFDYFRADDTMFRDVQDDAADAEHPYLRFVYTREGADL